jgi:hypothetical protein
VFSEHYEKQFVAWKRLRNKIEKVSDPFEQTILFWNMAPLVNKHLDPYRYKDWPNPWDIIKDGKYDELTKTIMVAHSLKLTKRFMKVPIEIRLYLDIDNKTVYNVCYIENKILNYPYGEVIIESDLPKNLVLQMAVPLTDYS